MPKIQCDNCNALIDSQKPKREVLKGLAYEFYWNCPECNHKYISYYTNKEIRRDIKRQEKRWERYRQIKTEQTRRKLLAEINMNDKLIKKDMDVLYKKMAKTLT